MRAVIKMTVRTVCTFFARFLAILLIVALSAGFFAGLKITTDAMLHTGETYMEEQAFYDLRLLSTIGFTEQEVERLGDLSGVEQAEGGYSVDLLMRYHEKVNPYKVYALTEKTNLVTLEAGRMPTAPNECLADVDRFDESAIGMTFSVVPENEESAKDQLKEQVFTVVGLCNTPVYLGLDRGTTNIGSGTVSTFLYVPKEAFQSTVYTELCITLEQKEAIYSDAYDKLIDEQKEKVTTVAEELVTERYTDLLAQNHLSIEMAEALGFAAPHVYTLTRNENGGYVSFENDTAILGSVANIFPVFFIAIAILVCATTMSRMVDEERTQIGVLKAMGFGNGTIVGKYLLYAALATVIGWGIGFFLCTWALPRVFWLAYNEIYNFAPITYLFSLPLAAITLAVSLVSILGTAYISCRHELREVPASLIRPRAGKVGKRVILERIRPLWSRMSFLGKITTRNMFLYKRRMIMMLVGISCCAGLLVTAFGVRDSMIDVGRVQFREIQNYQFEINYGENSAEEVEARLGQIAEIEHHLQSRIDYVDLKAKETMPSVRLLSYEDGTRFLEYWQIKKDGKTPALPEKGEVLISPKIAEKLSLSQGDDLEIRNASMEGGTLRVAGIFENHIYDYVIASEETYTEIFGEWKSNFAFLGTKGDVQWIGEQLTAIEAVTRVVQLSSIESNISEALNCLNYIIWLVAFFSAALAFIVIFNLTNINIAERRREIATVQVLGFYPKETESYVLKENLILSVVASILGLPLGKLFHQTVMGMVRIDMITFHDTVKPISYLIAFLLSVLFAVIVNRFMRRQIGKVNMAESLKAVE